MELKLEEQMKYELQKLYSIETQLVDGLKMLSAMAQNPELKAALTDHLEETKVHVSRVRQICGNMGWPYIGQPSKVIKAMQMETLEGLNGTEPSPVVDAVIIAAAQKAEHFEIASYGVVRALARQAGQTAAVELLQQTLDEEKAVDEKLTLIAESSVNRAAVATLR